MHVASDGRPTQFELGAQLIPARFHGYTATPAQRPRPSDNVNAVQLAGPCGRVGHLYFGTVDRRLIAIDMKRANH
jgi:hypothetical protein